MATPERDSLANHVPSEAGLHNGIRRIPPQMSKRSPKHFARKDGRFLPPFAIEWHSRRLLSALSRCPVVARCVDLVSPFLAPKTRGSVLLSFGRAGLVGCR
jgi:hypothetical protein